MSEQEKQEEEPLCPEELWDLYRRSSMLTGRPHESEEDEASEKPEKTAVGGGVQAAYSLWWLFAANALPKPEDAPLVHAFLGKEAAQRSLRAAYEKSERVPCDRKDYIGSAPNERQWQAIETALQSPISFIQGPPGTGKTATILNLVYQIAKLGKTAAIVSSNNSALENIHDKLKAGKEGKTASLASKVAKLGGVDKRDKFFKKIKKQKGQKSRFPNRQAQRYYYLQEKENAKEDEDAALASKEEADAWLKNREKDMRKRLKKDPEDKVARAWQQGMKDLKDLPKKDRPSARRRLLEDGWLMDHPGGTLQCVTQESGVTAQNFFRAGFVAFTSTVNSLPNCFEDGLFHQYDYVIVDEASQMGLSAGLLAMCHAKHLVLVGDEQQLAPVVDERVVAMMDGEFKEYDEQEIEAAQKKYAIYDKIACERDPDSFEEFDEEEWRQWKEEERLSKEWYTRWKNYRPRPEVSFLDLCLDVFLGRKDGPDRKGGLFQGLKPYPKVFLNQHYRCRKGIIEFCNETVYIPAGTPLEVCTPGCDKDKELPIKVLQFKGDYCESCYCSSSKREKEPDKQEPGGEETPEDARRREQEEAWAAEGEPIPPMKRPGRPSKRNLRQVEIFMEEEWPALLERLKGEEPFSVCILSPFRGQLRALEDAIKCYGRGIAEGEEPETLLSLTIDNTSKEKNKDEGKDEDKKKKKPASALTIHKSQGQEFDVVYLMPVEDGAWEWPFSQKKRMVNVAVSRAKKELRVITSQKYMNRELETQDVQKAKDEMYLKRLVDYVEEKATQRDEKQGFGIQSSVMASLFDAKKPRPMNASEEEKKTWVSAGQKLVEAALAEMAPRLGFSWTGAKGVDREVPVKRVLEELAGPGFRTDPRYEAFMTYINNEKTTFDCVIRNPDGKPVLAIEVDGAYHRYPWRDKEGDKDVTPDALYLRWRNRWRKDRMKDQIVKLAGGVVYYGNRKDLVRMVDKKRQVLHQWDRGENWGSFALLRLNDDGTTFLETDALRAAAKSADAPKKLTDKVFTIEGLIRRYLTPSLTSVWKTWPKEERDWLKVHLPGEGDLSTSRILKRLEELGVLEKIGKDWKATEKGLALGIRMCHVLDKGEPASYPIYPPRARQAVKKLLLEGMK